MSRSIYALGMVLACDEPTRRELQADARRRALSRVGQHAPHLGAQVQLAITENC